MVSIPNGGKWAAVKITTPLILYICISSNGIHAFLVLLFTRTPITKRYIFSKNEHELCHFHHWQIFCCKSNKNLSMEIALKSYARNIVCNEWMNYGQGVILYIESGTRAMAETHVREFAYRMFGRWLTLAVAGMSWLSLSTCAPLMLFRVIVCGAALLLLRSIDSPTDGQKQWRHFF